MTSMKIVKTPPPPAHLPVHLRSNFFHPLDLGSPILDETLPTLFNKLWNNNRTVHVNKRIQNKSKTKPRHIQIDHAYHCNGVIKGWLHCLTPESIGRFLVTNILSMMSCHGTNPIFFNKKKIKIGRPKHSQPHPSTPNVR